MPTETIIRTLKESKEDNPKHILPRTVMKAVADEDGNFISSDVTAQDINNLHGKTLLHTGAQSLTDAQKAQARQNINAAAPDGYYGDSGGVMQYSTNFLGKNTPQNAHDVTFRPTASEMSGQDWLRRSIESYTATIERIKGKTLVFNQLVQNGNFANGTTGWTGASATISAENGVCTVTCTSIPEVNYGYRITHNVGALPPIGNKVLIVADVYCDVATRIGFVSGGTVLTGSTTDVPAQAWTRKTYFVTNQAFGDYGLGITVNKNNIPSVGFEFKVKNIQSFNLTQMFGAGDEPATVEEFRAMFPLEYYAYNPGELISFNGTGLKTNGFNQLDADGHIRVLKGVTYRIEGEYTSLKDSAGNDVTVTNSEFTPAADDVYTMVGGSCVHFKWGGLRDGETEAYWDSTLALPVSTYFPDGMKSAGTAYDELTKNKAIKRIGKVDLGTLNWIYAPETSTHIAFFRTDFAPPNSHIIPNLSVVGPFLTAIYRTVSSNYLYKATDDNLIAQNYNESDPTISGRIWVKNLAYTDAAAFKAAMSGVYLYYELEESVETPISPALNLTYRVDDFGTELLLPENDDEPVTAPMDADIIYQIDYEATIRNSDSLNITKESMDAFIAAFNASGLGTITQTWDSVNKRYAYTVTAPQPAEGGETV